jgi:uncharacterized membrane-anchored protein YitT (DUF2179 family)
MFLVFGIAFVMPVFLVGLNLAGIVSGRQLLKAWRPVILGAFVFAAVATPSGDPWTMSALALPMLVLYYIATGLSLLLGYATGWPFAVLFAVVNVPFALLAVFRRGWDFTLRTVVSVALVSVFAPLHDALFPITGLQPLYGTLAGNLLAGVGVLILFRHRSSVGGINIIGLEIQDRTGFRAGWTMMIFDVIIVLLGFFVVPWPNVVMSAAGAVLLNLVLALNHRPGRYLGR